MHNNHQYHKEAILHATNFIECYHKPEKDIRNLLDTKRKEQALQNRLRLAPIIASIIFLGKQNIPLRGHRDSGILNLETNSTVSYSDSVINEGNFRELIRFRVASGDDNLKKSFRKY